MMNAMARGRPRYWMAPGRDWAARRSTITTSHTRTSGPCCQSPPVAVVLDGVQGFLLEDRGVLREVAPVAAGEAHGSVHRPARIVRGADGAAVEDREERGKQPERKDKM